MNIKELAKKAGLTVGTNISGVTLVGSPSTPGLAHISIDEMELFAALVLEEAANIAERTPKMSACDSNMAVQDYIAKKLRTEASALKGAKG